MTRLLTLSLLTLAACAAPEVPLPYSQLHGAARDTRLDGVLDDGRIAPGWGLTDSTAALPDTLDLPRMSALDWTLAMSGSDADTLRANVAGWLTGALLCPPCPPGAQCEPCGDDLLIVSAATLTGSVDVYVALPTAWSPANLRVGRSIVVSVAREGRLPRARTRLIGTGY
ncbi:hypothetical protein [Rubrivirga sp. IMCC45206]|uniref:hypothetical protein n=1 Tax=Rubrivirga sp. IMCC45206 TaxID=3391614 RepID=UPI00399015DD